MLPDRINLGQKTYGSPRFFFFFLGRCALNLGHRNPSQWLAKIRSYMSSVVRYSLWLVLSNASLSFHPSNERLPVSFFPLAATALLQSLSSHIWMLPAEFWFNDCVAAPKTVFGTFQLVLLLTKNACVLWRRWKLSDPHGNIELSFPSAVGFVLDEFFFVRLVDVNVVVDS